MKRIFNVYVNGQFDSIVEVSKDLFNYGNFKYLYSRYIKNGIVYAKELIEASENIFVSILKRISMYFDEVGIKSFEIKEYSKNEN